MDYSSGNSNVSSGKILYDNFKHFYDSIETPKYGYQIAINIGCGLTNKFSINTGIHFKNIGYKINMGLPVGRFDLNGYSTIIYSDNKRSDSYSNMDYIGIPLGLEYKAFSLGKFSMGFNIGSSVDLLIKHDTKYVTYPDMKSRDDYSEYSKISIDLNLGIYIDYSINDKFEVYLVPHFTDYVTPNVKINTVLSNDLFVKINQYNYYGDIKFGLKYKL
jgi:hypothetical protein